jgi:hypothetical protein
MSTVVFKIGMWQKEDNVVAKLQIGGAYIEARAVAPLRRWQDMTIPGT